MELLSKKCVPCEGGVPKLTSEEIARYQSMLEEPWIVVDNMKIVKEFEFSEYASTIAFVNKVAELAEEEGHHPVMHVSFSRIRIEIWTHAILGLSENDFILAAKIDTL
jgi:4a-hydroxytetrahydrobiopterin dehydratase